MALYTKMQKMVDATVEEFCRRLAEKHEGLNVEEMMGLWKETAKAPKKKDGKPKKKSAYMNFSQATRLLLRSEKPDLKFGEISTEVSRRWKALSDEEKSKYASTASAPADKAPSSPVVAILKNAVFSPPKKSKCLLKKVAAAAPPPSPVKVTPKKTMAELRKLCKERRLSIKGLKTREELEDVLAAADDDSGADSSEEDDEEYAGTLVDADDNDDGILA